MKQNHVNLTWTIGRESDIAATPQGGSDLINSPLCYEGKRLATLTSSPRYDTGTPQGGSITTKISNSFILVVPPCFLYRGTRPKQTFNILCLMGAASGLKWNLKFSLELNLKLSSRMVYLHE